MNTQAGTAAAPIATGRRFWAAIGTLAAVALMAVLTEQLNPDWFGYELIYREGGSWLTAQGRDPVFVLLIGSASTLLGPEGYGQFRFLVAAVFAVFTYLLLRGRILPLASGRAVGLGTLVALLPLLAPRITVQIREGLALVFFVVALGLLLRLEDRMERAGADARQAAGSGWVVAALVVLVGLGLGMHAGTLVIALSLAMAWLVSRFAAGSSRVEFHAIVAAAVVATSVVVALAIFVPNTTWGTRTIAGTFGWLVDGRASMSPEKWAYWLVYGAGIFTLVARMTHLASGGALGPVSRPLASVLALVCLPALYACALILLASGVPPIVVSALARTLNMLVALLMLIVAFRGRIGLRIGLFAVFVLVDQARIISEAVVTTFEGVT